MRIVHVHLPKTAGTALRESIQRSVSPKLRICPATYERQFKEINFGDYDFFSGHISFQLASQIGGDYITVLRDPVDRFLSVYYFWRELFDKGVEISRNTTLARNFELNDFVGFFDEPTLTEEFYNRMTWQLAYSSATQDRGAWRQKHKLSDLAVLDLAKENLEKFSIVGFQEQYDTVIDKLNIKYGLNIKNEHINVTERRKNAGALTTDIIARICQWTYLDSELYKYALVKFGIK